MIRRDSGRDYLLITQTDHAAVAGELASHCGNSRFSKPSPVVIAATKLHDSGWPLHDDAPTLSDRGIPLDVFEVPRSIALKVWAASADRAAGADPYAGLLVSLHSLSLSIHADVPVAKQPVFDVRKMHDQFAVNKFQHREIERQEQLRRALGFDMTLSLKHGLADAGASPRDDQLRFDFHLLQAMDLISLCLCCTKPPMEKTNDVLRNPTASPTKLRLSKSLDGIVHVDPWPFDQKRIDLQVPCRRVDARPFASQEEFLVAYANAKVGSVSTTIAV
jgi:hypothetical protein